MADNVTLDPGAGGATIAADEVTPTVFHQRVKVQHGADGTATDVSTASPLPVSDAGGSITVDDGASSLSVDDNGGSLTVDGTVTANAGTGTFTVDQVNTADIDYDSGGGTVSQAVVGVALPGAGGPVAGGTVTNPFRVDVVGTTAQPVTDNGGSLTIDGTVTANAGTGNFTVINGGTFAVQDSEKLADNAGFTDGTTKLQPAGYIFDEVAGTALTENDIAAPRVDSKRASVLVIEDETTRGRRTTVTASNALKVDPSAVTSPVSLASVPSHAVTNAGVFAIQDSEKLADDAGFTVGTTKVLPVGLLADQTATDSVDEGDVGIPRMTLDRKTITTTAPSADTEGLAVFRTIDADETEEDVKTTAGKLYGWYLYNDAAAEAYVKFYNATAANTTVGSTTPLLTIPVPAGSAANVEFTNGITFSTALCVAATMAVSDADATAPVDNTVIVNVFYK